MKKLILIALMALTTFSCTKESATETPENLEVNLVDNLRDPLAPLCGNQAVSVVPNGDGTYTAYFLNGHTMQMTGSQAADFCDVVNYAKGVLSLKDYFTVIENHRGPLPASPLCSDQIASVVPNGDGTYNVYFSDGEVVQVDEATANLICSQMLINRSIS